ncbi:unnamed protein product, partial [Prorocentrum cordatum]
RRPSHRRCAEVPWSALTLCSSSRRRCAGPGWLQYVAVLALAVGVGVAFAVAALPPRLDLRCVQQLDGLIPTRIVFVLEAEESEAAAGAEPNCPNLSRAVLAVEAIGGAVAGLRRELPDGQLLVGVSRAASLAGELKLTPSIEDHWGELPPLVSAELCATPGPAPGPPRSGSPAPAARRAAAPQGACNESLRVLAVCEEALNLTVGSPAGPDALDVCVRLRIAGPAGPPSMRSTLYRLSESCSASDGGSSG